MSTKPLVESRADTASAVHDRLVAANVAQRERLSGPEEDIWAGRAGNFRADPKRPLDALLTKVASYLRAEDTLVDIGGGAGRLSLPLAGRCRKVVVVDPSPAMREGFEKVVMDAGIGNARFIEAAWLDEHDIEGDVALVAHVTYFVPNISPFIEKLHSATRRRVIVCVRSVPPPNQMGPFIRLAHGEDYAPVPGHNELQKVLEQRSIASELIDVGPAIASATASIGKTREDAIRGEVESAKKAGWLGAVPPQRLGDLIEQHFDELLVETEQGFLRRSVIDARDLLITWETH